YTIYKLIKLKKRNKIKKGSIFAAITTAIILALAPTIIIFIILFAIFGTTILTNNVFSLDINVSQLMIFTLSLFVYLYTIDCIIAVLIKHILGIESIFYYLYGYSFSIL